MGENHFAAWPVAVYGVVLLCAAIAFTILTVALRSHHDRNSTLDAALGRDLKGKVSIALYITAIFLVFANPLYSCALYVTVAIIWLVPDRRIERVLEARASEGNPSPE